MDKTKEEELVKDIKLRFEQLDEQRQKFIERWTTAQNYVSPVCYSWTDLDSIPSTPKRYTSSPCDYLNTLVNGLVGYSISPSIQWFKLTLTNRKLLDLYGIKDWLEQVEDVLYGEFNRSNLYAQAPKIISDAATIGHGILIEEEDFYEDKLKFNALRPNEIWLDINEYGDVDTVFRKYLITLKNAVAFFGLENLHEDLREQYKVPAKHNSKIEILCAVYPRTKRDEKNPDSKNKPYAVYFVDLNHNHIIKESGYDENPFIIFEWDQIPGLSYSNSPAINALPDIRYLDIANRTSMEICQTSAAPPMRAHSSLRNISVVPRGVVYVDSPDQILEPIRTGENYPITLQIVEAIEQRVKNWFNVDFFLSLQQKQGKMTATEVMELQGEKSAVLSNLVVQLNSMLSKIIQRSFNLLWKKGKIPPPPETLINQYGANMEVDFIGPLAQQLKKYHTMGGIASAIQLARPIMEMFPNSADYLNPDELMKRAMEGQAMPQAVIREDDDVQKIREERAMAKQQAQMQAQQQAMSQSIMQNANKLNAPIQDDSLLSALNEQLAGGMNG